MWRKKLQAEKKKNNFPEFSRFADYYIVRFTNSMSEWKKDFRLSSVNYLLYSHCIFHVRQNFLNLFRTPMIQPMEKNLARSNFAIDDCI